MTGRRLYDKYVDALLTNRRRVWRQGGHYETVFPLDVPVAWPFLSDDRKRTFNTLAKSITPTKRKAA